MRYLFLIFGTLVVLAGCGSSGSDVLNVSTQTPSASEATVTATEENASISKGQATATLEPESIDTATSSAEESATATPTEAPTATPTIVPTATAAPSALSLISQGFGQAPESRAVGWSFVVENPNPTSAIENSQYQVAILDQAGTVLESDSGYINFISPTERQGIAGTTYLPEGATAASIDVTLNQGKSEAVDFTDHLNSSQVLYFDDDISPKVTGIITSPFTRALEDIRISAVAYDATGTIIGGGFTFLSFISAEGQTGVSVSLTSASDPASVELYASISGLTLLSAGASDAESGPQELAVAAQGFGQEPESQRIGWGFIVENPDPENLLSDSRYHVVVYDDAGNVLDTSSSYINALLPGAKLGIAGTMYIPDGTTAARVDAHVLAGDVETGTFTPVLAVENVTFVDDSYTPKVTGIVKNTSDQVLENIEVAALAYNEAGEIIGGNFTYVDFVPAQGQAAVDVSITSSSTPARVELYPAITVLTELAQ